MSLTSNRTYLLRVTIELYDGVDAKTRRHAEAAEHLQRTFTARDDSAARVIQAHCWHTCGLAVFNELQSVEHSTNNVDNNKEQ